MKEQAEAKRISRLPGATRSVGAATDNRATTRAFGAPIARPGLAKTFLVAAILFVAAGLVVNVLFFIFGGFAAFGALLMCFPDPPGGDEMAQGGPATLPTDLPENRDMIYGTPEYFIRHDQPR